MTYTIRIQPQKWADEESEIQWGWEDERVDRLFTEFNLNGSTVLSALERAVSEYSLIVSCNVGNNRHPDCLPIRVDFQFKGFSKSGKAVSYDRFAIKALEGSADHLISITHGEVRAWSSNPVKPNPLRSVYVWARSAREAEDLATNIFVQWAKENLKED